MFEVFRVGRADAAVSFFGVAYFSWVAGMFMGGIGSTFVPDAMHAIAAIFVGVFAYVLGLLQRPVFRADFGRENRTTVRADAPLIVGEAPRTEGQECEV